MFRHFFIFAAVRYRYLNIRNSTAAWLVLSVAFVLYLFLWFRSEWPAGGQDSWNHYLYARWSLVHPELMLDQWGKPLFTIPVIPFALPGIEGVYVFNILATLTTAWLLFIISRKLGMRLPWIAAAFFLFQPIVFGNVISSLTEPVNALLLTWMIYLYVSGREISATVLASFLPYVRSEGFVLIAAVMLFLVVRKKWKLLPVLLVGSLVFTMAAGLIFHQWDWIVTSNPYIQHEVKGKFDPGSGDFLHYFKAQKFITGIVVTVLVVFALLILIGHVFYLLKKRTPEEKSRFCFWLIAPLFLSFFLAHSFIWWSGSMGSHGLERVFFTVAPCAALLALYAFDRILSFEIRGFNKFIPTLITVLSVFLAYAGNNFPAPWQNIPAVKGYPAEPQIAKAFEYIQQHHLEDKILVHQLPYLNAKLGFDPWAKPEKAQTYYLWSLDKTPGKDWLPDGCVVLWDGWHAVRDSPMPLSEMRKLTDYKEVAYFPATDSIYDVRLFIKNKK